MTTTYVRGKINDGPPARDRRPMIPLAPTRRRAVTYYAPVSDPGGRTRTETWGANSADGLWEFHRIDDGGTTPWRALYLPTGQYRTTYGALSAARRAAGPAGELLDEFREQAAALAYEGATPGERADGHRLLAGHLRILGVHAADHRCACGGYLVAPPNGGPLAHLDACAQCWQHGVGYVADLVPAGDEQGRRTIARAAAACRPGHLFCGAPEPVATARRTG